MVRNFAKRTHVTLRTSRSKYTLREFPHPHQPIACYVRQQHRTNQVLDDAPPQRALWCRLGLRRPDCWCTDWTPLRWQCSTMDLQHTPAWKQCAVRRWSCCEYACHTLRMSVTAGMKRWSQVSDMHARLLETPKKNNRILRTRANARWWRIQARSDWPPLLDQEFWIPTHS